MSAISDVIHAERRTATGKGAGRKLRAAGRVPAIAYGGNNVSIMLSIDPDEFTRARRHYGPSHVYLVSVKGEDDLKALVREVQWEPAHAAVVHVDFWTVDMAAETTMMVGLEITGRCKGVVVGGQLRQLRRQVALCGMPENVPDKVVLDVTDVDAGESILVQDLELPSGVRPAGDENYAVVTVARPKRGAADDSEAEE